MFDYKPIVIRTVEAIWNQGELRAVDEMFADHIVYHSPATPKDIIGREGFKQWVVTLRTAFPDLTMHIAGNLIAESNQVAARWMLYGTHLNPLAYIPASGRSIAVRGQSIYRFESGCLAEIWDMYDLNDMLEQLGVRHQAQPEPA
jgi:steroid delta-isomerase-like uncharacterized protein